MIFSHRYGMCAHVNEDLNQIREHELQHYFYCYEWSCQIYQDRDIMSF